jgi:hypothetical protein
VHRGWPGDRDAVRARLRDVSRRACSLGTIPTYIGRRSRIRSVWRPSVGHVRRRVVGGRANRPRRGALPAGAVTRILTSLPLTAARYGRASRRAQRSGPQDSSLTLWDEWLIQRLGKGANVPDACIAKRSSRRDQRWPLLSSLDAAFIPSVPQACIIRSYPRSGYVVSRQIADARCLRCRGCWRFDDRVRSQALGTGIPSRRV